MVTEQIDYYELIQAEVKASHDTIQAVKQALQNPSCSNCKWALRDEDMSVCIWLHIERCSKSWPNIPDPLFDDEMSAEERDEECAYLCGAWELNWESCAINW